jgi:hypothetical protein
VSSAVALGITGIVVSGVAGPAVSAWFNRRGDQLRFASNQFQRRREDLRAIVDEGAVLLGAGETTDPIKLDFALEAKCYGADNGVGVRELSRLISRLRHRQFGVLVTTSYLAPQAYEELRVDDHPVVVISARDIVEILRRHGISTPAETEAWLQREFPAGAPRS